MKQTVRKTLCALAVLATTSAPALAAESVDMTVTGTIVPAACTPTLSNGGAIDYGTIVGNTLTPGNYTLLPEKQITLTITCDAPAKVAVKSYSNRPGSLVGSENDLGLGMTPSGVYFGSTGTTSMAAGLGMDGSAKIGGFGVSIAAGQSTADANSVIPIRASITTPNNWAVAAEYTFFSNASAATQRVISWATTSTTVPVAFTNLTTVLDVQAFLNKPEELDLTKPITLDGSVTLEMYYL